MTASEVSVTETFSVQENTSYDPKPTNEVNRLDFRPWEPEKSGWRLKEGNLTKTHTRADAGTFKEHGLVWDSIKAADIEFGFALRVDRNANKHWYTLVSARSTLPSDASNTLNRTFHGVKFRLTENQYFFLDSKVSSPMIPARIERYQPDSLKDAEYRGFHELMNHLRQSRLSQDGGAWIAVRVVGAKCEVVWNGESIQTVDLTQRAANNDPAAEEFAESIGSPGILMWTPDWVEPATIEVEDFYYRVLD